MKRYPISGKMLKLARDQKELKQEVVAEFLGMSQSNYSRIEEGYIPLSVEKLNLAAQLLDLSPTALVTCQDQMQLRMTEGERRGSFVCRNGKVLLRFLVVEVLSWFFIDLDDIDDNMGRKRKL